MKYFHPHYVNCVRIIISTFLWTLINKISARWWTVQLGRYSKFQGKTYFRLQPGSKIVIGDNCHFLSSNTSNLIGIYSPCIISTLSRVASISIGDKCGFSGTIIGSSLEVKLGNNVRCGANTLITDTDWHTDDDRIGKDSPVLIEDNVWLGYGVKVLKGVHIGENTVIGACSVVTHDIPANVIAAGNPCKVIRRL